MLELAILGELEEPAHGYELRKRLARSLGPLRRLSFGSLYPALHRLADRGLIAVVGAPSPDTKSRKSGAEKRQVVYQTTAVGRDFLQSSLAHAAVVDDETLALTMGLMSRATPATRLTLLMRRRAEVLARHEAGLAAKQSPDFWIRSKGELDSQQALSELSWIDRVIQTDPGLKEISETNPDTKGHELKGTL